MAEQLDKHFPLKTTVKIENTYVTVTQMNDYTTCLTEALINMKERLTYLERRLSDIERVPKDASKN